MYSAPGSKLVSKQEFFREQTATCATYSLIWLVFIIEMKSVYSAVRTGDLTTDVCAWALKGKKKNCLVYTSLTWNSNLRLSANSTSICFILTLQRRRTFKLFRSQRTDEFKFPTSSAPVCIRGIDLRFHTCRWMPYVV